MAIKRKSFPAATAESKPQAITEITKNFYFIIPQMENTTRFFINSVISCNEWSLNL